MPKYNQEAIRQAEFATTLKNTLGNVRSYIPNSVPENTQKITASVDLVTGDVEYAFLDDKGKEINL